MKQKEFNEMPIGTQVRIKGRLGKLVSYPITSSGGYSWATFEYLNTHRKVIKRHRQVERVF